MTIIYDLHAAEKIKGHAVICEGVTDVWRLRRNAIALLGKTMLNQQCTMIARHLCERPLVVLLDSEAPKKRSKSQDSSVHCGVI